MNKLLILFPTTIFTLFLNFSSFGQSEGLQKSFNKHYQENYNKVSIRVDAAFKDKFESEKGHDSFAINKTGCVNGNCDNGNGTCLYNLKGEKYIGGFINSSRHGRGIYYFANGKKYDGQWKYHEANGFGTFYHNNGEKYVGNFLNSDFNGQGTYYYSSGDRYVGQWEDDKRHGQGTLYYNDRDKYVGQWKYDNRHGQGAYYHSSGDKYVGQWEDGKQHGQGTFYLTNGSTYVGLWKFGQLDGKGILYMNDGTSEECFWVNGELQNQNTEQEIGCINGDCENGKGTYLYNPNGEKYIGDFVNFQRHGKGIYSFANGERYEGQWENDKRNGQGTLYLSNDSDGNKIKGNFKDGELHGQASMHMIGGSIYVGPWEFGQLHGKGILYLNDGTTKEWFWLNGVLQNIDTEFYLVILLDTKAVALSEQMPAGHIALCLVNDKGVCKYFSFNFKKLKVETTFGTFQEFKGKISRYDTSIKLIVSKEEYSNMMLKAEKAINKSYVWPRYVCSDFVQDVLKSGGIPYSKKFEVVDGEMIPLLLFDEIRKRNKDRIKY
jgi:hypothetical protein